MGISLRLVAAFTAAMIGAGQAQAQSNDPAEAPAIRISSVLVASTSPAATSDPRFGGANRLVKPVGLIDQLFGAGSSNSAGLRRRSTPLAIGDADLVVETMRQRPAVATFGGTDGRHVRIKRWAVGVRRDFTLSDSDGVSLGASFGKMRRWSPDQIFTGKRSATRTMAVDLVWTHDAHWQFDLGWKSDGSTHRRIVDRLTEIAGGAALNGSGPRFELAFTPTDAGSAHPVSFGIDGKAMKLAERDRWAVGTDARTDMRAGMFMRASF